MLKFFFGLLATGWLARCEVILRIGDQLNYNSVIKFTQDRTSLFRYWFNNMIRLNHANNLLKVSLFWAYLQLILFIMVWGWLWIIVMLVYFNYVMFIMSLFYCEYTESKREKRSTKREREGETQYKKRARERNAVHAPFVTLRSQLVDFELIFSWSYLS